jgi:hypothetical protein
METERKYQMVRLGAGDWLLPSNDLTTLWRFRRYQDGPSLGLMDWSRDIDVWAVWTTPMPASMRDYDELYWTDVAGPLFSRRACIEFALTA